MHRLIDGHPAIAGLGLELPTIVAHEAVYGDGHVAPTAREGELRGDGPGLGRVSAQDHGRTERGTVATRMDAMDAKVREMEDRWRDAKAGLRAGKERGDKDVSKRLKLLEETIDAKYLRLQKTLNQVVLEQQAVLTRLEETDSNEGVEEEGESALNISSSSVEGRLSSSFVKAQTDVMEGYREEASTKLKRVEEELARRIGELEETLEVATVELETEQSALGRKFDDWAADQHVRHVRDSSDAQAIESTLRTELTRAKEEMARKVDDMQRTVRSVEAALRAEWSTWRESTPWWRRALLPFASSSSSSPAPSAASMATLAWDYASTVAQKIRLAGGIHWVPSCTAMTCGWRGHFRTVPFSARRARALP